MGWPSSYAKAKWHSLTTRSSDFQRMWVKRLGQTNTPELAIASLPSESAQTLTVTKQTRSLFMFLRQSYPWTRPAHQEVGPFQPPARFVSPSFYSTPIPMELFGLKSIFKLCLIFLRRFRIETFHKKCFLWKVSAAEMLLKTLSTALHFTKLKK